MPLAEHDEEAALLRLSLLVSIHVPLAEHDLQMSAQAFRKSLFQFTCPSRSTTFAFGVPAAIFRVSIHVPLAEHDGSSEEQAGEPEVSIHVPLAEHD